MVPLPRRQGRGSLGCARFGYDHAAGGAVEGSDEVRRRNHQTVVPKRIAGIQSQSNSLFITSAPRPLKKRRMEIGATTIGRQGRKYRSLSNGAKKATPKPPFVMASRR